jgi:hypothetical protein
MVTLVKLHYLAILCSGKSVYHGLTILFSLCHCYCRLRLMTVLCCRISRVSSALVLRAVGMSSVRAVWQNILKYE